jgi:hypothetical protein
VISHFDSSGKGLVNVKIDGQIVRVLATLEDSDKPKAAEIVPGDQLLEVKPETLFSERAVFSEASDRRAKTIAYRRAFEGQ